MNKQNAALAGALVGLGGTITNAMNDNPEFVPCGRPAGIVMTNVAVLGDELPAGELAQRTQMVLALMNHVGEHHGAEVAGAYDASSLSPVKVALLDALTELTGLALPALQRGVNDRETSAYFYRSLAAVAADDAAAEAQLGKLADVMDRARTL